MHRTLVLLLCPLLLAALGPGAEGAPAQRAASSTTDYVLPVTARSFAYSPGSGATSPSSTVLLYSTGSAWSFVTTTSATRRLAFHVVADQCEGAPVLGVAVDGVTLMTRESDGEGDYGVAGTWAPGRHQVTFRFLNDHLTGSCDRNLRISSISLYAHTDGSVHAAATRQRARQQYAVLPAGSGDALTDGQVHVAGDGTVGLRLDSQGAYELYLVLTPADCDPWAELEVRVDGVVYQSGRLPPTLGSTGVSTIDIRHAFANGPHDIELEFGDLGSRADGCRPTSDLDFIQFDGWV